MTRDHTGLSPDPYHSFFFSVNLWNPSLWMVPQVPYRISVESQPIFLQLTLFPRKMHESPIVLYLNVPNINYLGSGSGSLDRCLLLGCAEPNCLLALPPLAVSLLAMEITETPTSCMCDPWTLLFFLVLLCFLFLTH